MHVEKLSGSRFVSSTVVLEVVCLPIDLGFQMLLISQDVFFPLGDGLLLAHPDLLCHLVKMKERDGV